MQVFETQTLVQDSFQEFISYLNPTLEYEVMITIHLQGLQKFWTFEKSEQSELMFIASLMQANIYVADEMIIRQGDTADKIYFIVSGEVQVFMSQLLKDIKAG